MLYALVEEMVQQRSSIAAIEREREFLHSTRGVTVAVLRRTPDRLDRFVSWWRGRTFYSIVYGTVYSTVAHLKFIFPFLELRKLINYLNLFL